MVQEAVGFGFGRASRNLVPVFVFSVSIYRSRAEGWIMFHGILVIGLKLVFVLALVFDFEFGLRFYSILDSVR